MIEVTILNSTKKESQENITFTCDSYEIYDNFYKFNFGQIGCMWSHNFNKSIVKSINILK